MAIITVPENSFYTMDTSIVDIHQNGCDIPIKACLPVYNLSDIEFQIHTATTPASTLYVGIIDGITGAAIARTTAIWETISTYYDDFNSTYKIAVIKFTGNLNDIRTKVGVGNCFRISIFDDTLDTIYYTKNCFIVVYDPCKTTQLKYRSDENTFGIDYNNDDISNQLASHHQIVRLPFYYKQPQYKSERSIYRKSDGTYLKLSSRMEKEYLCKTDYLFDEWHKRFAIALEHDKVYFDTQAVMMNDNYDIDWITDEPDYPMAQANFKVKESPFNNFNFNCNVNK